jgi:hypothetical protein
MLVMLVCGVLLATGIALAWRWRAYGLQLPAWVADEQAGRGAALRALVWLLNVALLTGLLVGALVVGPAGRLAMRLLAATSSEASQGRLTDAGEVVGEITLSGTISFFLFVGLPFGVVVACAYVFVSFVLPRGVVGGAILGVSLLVVFGSAVDPLRKDNPDFDILGPGWLSVVTFCGMAALTGIVTAPIAGRIGAALPIPRLWWAAWLLPVGLVVVGAVATTRPWVAAICLTPCLAFVAALLVPTPRRQNVWRWGRRVLQATLATIMVIAAPGFFFAVASIAA